MGIQWDRLIIDTEIGFYFKEMNILASLETYEHFLPLLCSLYCSFGVVRLDKSPIKFHVGLTNIDFQRRKIK